MTYPALPMVLNDSQANDLVESRVDPRGYQAERIAQEELWIRNIAFYAGKQHFIQDGIRIREPQNVPAHRVFYKSNLILPAVTRAVAKVMSTHAELAVAPVSDLPQHRHSAHVSDRVLTHQQDIVKYTAKKSRAFTWAAIAGSAFLRITWNPNSGKPQNYFLEKPGGQGERQALSPAEQQQRLQDGAFKSIAPGEIDMDIVSPFALFHDWSARDGGIDQSRWIATVQYLDVDLVSDKYNIKIEDIVPDDNRFGPIYYEEAIAFLSTGIGGLNLSIPTPNEKRQRRARVVEYWERPSGENGNLGRYIVQVGSGTVVQNTDNKYRATGFPLPFVMVNWLPLPGRFWGLSLVEQLTSPQFQYNKARATLIEFQDVYGHPATFVPENSGIPTGSFTIAPGSVHSYTPSAGPIITGPTPNLPAEVAGNASICEHEISTISSQSDPDMSKLPAQIRGSEGIRMMLEEKNRVLHPIFVNAVAVDLEVGRQLLSLGQLHYETDRVLRYFGQDGEWVVDYFNKMDISTELNIVGDVKAIDSVAARQASVLDAVQVGIFNPLESPEDKAYVHQALGYRTGEEAIKQKLVDARNQEREIEEIIGDPTKYLTPQQPGQPPGMPVREWEDHGEHERVVRSFMKTDRFRSLDPMSSHVIFQHWKLHKEIVDAQQMQALQMQMAMKGTQGSKGRASQPAR